MLDIVGSQYQDSGQTLPETTEIILRDHHYNETTHRFAIETMLEHNPAHWILADHIARHEDRLCHSNWLYVPSFITRELEEFAAAAITSTDHPRTHAFNFIINKPRIHRRLLLAIIEQEQLTSYRHSLPWNTPEIDINLAGYQQTRTNIARTDYKFGDERRLDQGIRNGSHPNAKTFKHLLKPRVFDSTGISLITEPAYYERETIITEKTLMCMYALTIPIWVGGWRIASYMQDLGFDVFADIVDHSYETNPDPAERVRLAITLNRDLLIDPELTNNLIQANRSRLMGNLTHLKTNPFLAAYKEKIKLMPDSVKKAARRLIV